MPYLCGPIPYEDFPDQSIPPHVFPGPSLDSPVKPPINAIQLLDYDLAAFHRVPNATR